MDAKQIKKRVGAEFNALRTAKGMNQAEVADLLPDGSRTTYGQWETGYTNIGIVQFVQVCEALDESPAALLARVLGGAAAPDEEIRKKAAQLGREMLKLAGEA